MTKTKWDTLYSYHCTSLIIQHIFNIIMELLITFYRTFFIGWRFLFFCFSFIWIIIGEDNLAQFPAEDMESLSRTPRLISEIMIETLNISQIQGGVLPSFFGFSLTYNLFNYPKHQYRKLYFNVFRKMGTPGEEDFLGVDKPKYENKRDRNRNRHRIGNWGTVETINITMLSLPTRGSKKSVTLKVPLLTPGDTRVSFIKS